jgi:hypothetical protein
MLFSPVTFICRYGRQSYLCSSGILVQGIPRDWFLDCIFFSVRVFCQGRFPMAAGSGLFICNVICYPIIQLCEPMVAKFFLVTRQSFIAHPESATAALASKLHRRLGADSSPTTLALNFVTIYITRYPD